MTTERELKRRLRDESLLQEALLAASALAWAWKVRSSTLSWRAAPSEVCRMASCDISRSLQRDLRELRRGR